MDIKKVIAKYPRIHLTPLPTPLEFAPQLTKMLGGPKIYVKRDDLTAIAFGGNKTRKLEFLMADAVKQNADTVITLGGVQSNWQRRENWEWIALQYLKVKCRRFIRAMFSWIEFLGLN